MQNSSSWSNVLKFTLQHTRQIKTIGILVAVLLVLRLNYETMNDGYNMPSRSVQSVSETGTVIAVINTPKMGTGGLSQSFINSWKCVDGSENSSYLTYNCPNNGIVVRSHGFDGGAQAVQMHRQEYPEGKCLIVSALRSPGPWFPSLYVQKKGICEDISITREEMLQDYKQWLSEVIEIENASESCLPGLLQEFNGGSLVEQAKIMDDNNGYSILGPASPESVFAGCELLFMRMEQSDRWPDIIQLMVPENTFYHGESRASQCPELADHIKMLQEYEITKDEKMAIYNRGGPFIADWFDAYGYIEERSQESIELYRIPETDIEEVSQESNELYSIPETVIAVINTPKTGTGGLTRNFENSLKCVQGHEASDLVTFNCPDNKLVVRTHSFNAGLQAVQNHRKEHPGGKCLIVSALRSPDPWLTSLYVQKKRICEDVSITKEEMLEDYKQWLRNSSIIRSTAESCLPGLLREFNGGSLVEQTQIMDDNNGYSILGPASSESGFAGCELLFLRMEQNDRWPEIIQMMVPENKFYRGESRASQCPELADHIKMLQEYEISRDEKMAIYKRAGVHTADWFDAYGHSAVE